MAQGYSVRRTACNANYLFIRTKSKFNESSMRLENDKLSVLLHKLDASFAAAGSQSGTLLDVTLILSRSCPNFHPSSFIHFRDGGQIAKHGLKR